MPGPPPTPTALLNLRGSRRGKRRGSEPQPVPLEPGTPAPAWLDARACKEWERVLPELERLKLLTVVDYSALAIYCQEVSRYIDAVRHIKKEGSVYWSNNRDGEPNVQRQSIWVTIAQNSASLVRAYAREFGLSPAARVGLPGKKTKTQEDSGKTARSFIRLA